MRAKKIYLSTPLIALIIAIISVFALTGCSNKTEPNTKIEFSTVATKLYTDKAELTDAVYKSVVAITTEKTVASWAGQYVTQGAGSGVVMAVDSTDNTIGYIITANSVIDGASSITVTLYDNSIYTATVVGQDAAGNIAVIKVDAENTLDIAVFGNSDKLRVGESVIAIGNPLGTLASSVTSGIVSSVEREIMFDDYKLDLIQTDAAINPGNSGGALFNMCGQVIGIVIDDTIDTTSSNSIEGIRFAIPSNTAKSLFVDLCMYSVVQGRSYLGFSAASATTLFGDTVVYVDTLNSAAEKAGLSKYDKIVSIGGVNISSVGVYHSVMSLIKPNHEVQIEYSNAQMSGMSLSWSSEVKSLKLTSSQMQVNQSW